MAKSFKQLLMEFRKSATLTADDGKRFDKIVKELDDAGKLAKSEQDSSASALKKLLNDVADTSEEAAKRYANATQQAAMAMRDQYNEQLKNKDLTTEEIALLNQKVALLDQQLRATDIQVKSSAKAAAQLDTYIQNLGLAKSAQDSFIGNLMNGGPMAFSMLKDQLKGYLSLQNIANVSMFQFSEKTMELAKAFDKSQAELARSTGTTGEYNDLMYDAQEQNKAFGVSLEEANKAISTLHNELAVFNRMNTESQMMLTETSMRLQAIGVDAAEGAQQFDNLIMGMGMGATQANNASLELVALGDNIGVAADVISKDFNNAASELAKFGPQATKVFKGMAAAAKATGIEMGKLMGIAKQFDTFEGAAVAAGKLNAILGGGVMNSMELLNATEEERIRLMIQGMQASGKNFASLNRFEKQAIASAAGIEDMTEANKIFSMSLSGYDAMQSKASAAAASNAKLEERAAAATDMTKKFKLIMEGFAVAFKPVLDVLHVGANLILQLNDATGGFLIPVLGAASIAFMMYAKSVGAGNAATGAGLLLKQASIAIGNAEMIQKAKTAIMDKSEVAMKGLKNTLSSKENFLKAMGNIQDAASVKLQKAKLAVMSPITSLKKIGFAISNSELGIRVGLFAIDAKDFALQKSKLAVSKVSTGMMATKNFLLKSNLISRTRGLIVTNSEIAMQKLKNLFQKEGIIMQMKENVMTKGGLVFTKLKTLLTGGLALATKSKAAADAASVGPQAAATGGLAGFISVGMSGLPVLLAVAQAALGIGMAFLGIGLAIAAPFIAIAMIVTAFKDLFIAMMKMTDKIAEAAGGLILFGAAASIALVMIGAALIPFSIALAIATPFLVVGAIGIAAMGLAMLIAAPGFYAFGAAMEGMATGLKMFLKLKFGKLVGALANFALFITGLVLLSPLVLAAGILAGIPLLIIGMGLGKFSKSLKLFMKTGRKSMAGAVANLMIFTMGLLLMSPFILAAGILAGIPLLIIGFGLNTFAKGIARFQKTGGWALMAALASLTIFSIGLLALSPLLLAIAILAGVPMLIIGFGLIKFAEGLRKFARVGKKSIDGAIANLLYFTTSMIFLAVPLAAIAVIVGLPLLILGMGLMSFAKALRQFGKIANADIPAAVGMLTYFTFNMLALAAPLMLLSVLAPFMIAGIIVIAAGLAALGGALALISDNMSGILALDLVFQSLATIAGGAATAASSIAMSIFGIAMALMFVPEKKAIALGFTLDGYAAAMTAVASLTPESVEAADKIVEAAGRYVELQAEMRLPDQDSFLQAMKSAFGGGDSDSGGQDIILEINGREFGRAVDAAINSRHKLSMD